MGSSSSAAPRDASYSRKQKSLSILCSNFLSLYNRIDGSTSLVGLDDAAARLGVVRRRIYDVVNVLESVGLLARKSKNTYTWRGFAAVPAALDDLKSEGLDLNFAPNPNPTDESKREKSLTLLAQNFVKLFLCTGSEAEWPSISLDAAARLLLGAGEQQTAAVMRTKVRRIYDIANVLTSVNMIQKTHTPDGKPAYRWLGMKGKPENSNNFESTESTIAPEPSKKRMFGADLTNLSSKRSKEGQQRAMQLNKGTNINSEGSKGFITCYQFGPFAPVPPPPETTSRLSKVCWETLGAPYRPQYQNKALQELFSHYKEAWNTWNSQVANKNKNPIQIS